MDVSSLVRRDEFTWEIPATGAMRVPGVLYATRELTLAMDEKVREQVRNVAALPGIVGGLLRDARRALGLRLPDRRRGGLRSPHGGVVSAGGVGFDISCGVRCLHTGLCRRATCWPTQAALAEALFARDPRRGRQRGQPAAVRRRARRDAAPAARAGRVEQGFGEAADLERIEEQRLHGRRRAAARLAARQASASAARSARWARATTTSRCSAWPRCSTPSARDAFGLEPGDVVVSIHCGSRGLGHQIGTEFLGAHGRGGAGAAASALPDRELACAPIESDLGQRVPRRDARRRSTAPWPTARS